MESMIEVRIASGHYQDADEVLSEALRLLAERDRKLTWLRAEVQKGLEQADRGETAPFTDDFIDRALDRARENGRRGKPIKDAVKPQPAHRARGAGRHRRHSPILARTVG